MCLSIRNKQRRIFPYILFLIAILFFSCQSEKKYAVVKNGMIDLSAWDFTQGGNVPLKGEWAFYWGKYLRGSDFDKEAKTVFIDVPSGWEKYKTEKGDFLPVEGYATYRVLVKIPKKYNKTEVLGVRVQFLTSNYALYIQDKLMNSHPTLGTSALTAKAHYNPDVYYFVPESDTVEIVLHISNYAYRSGGFIQHISFGKVLQISREFERTLVINFLSIGALLMMGGSHLIIYFFRKKTTSILYFSLYCLIVALRSLVVDDYTFSDIFPNAHFEVGNKISYLTFSIGVPTLVIFLNSLYPEDFSKRIVKITLIGSAIFSTIVIFTNSLFYSKLLIYYQLFALILILYTFYFTIRILYYGRQGSIIFAFGLLTISFTAINDILVTNLLIDNMNLMPVGSFAFIFSQTLILSKSYATTFAQTEEMTHRLRKNNQLLAEVVSHRTSALAKTNIRLLQNLENLKTNITLFNTQKAKIEAQHKSITSSINYAKNIQSNIFPALEVMQGSFSDLFLLFKPKDIISGDIYYFKNVGDKIVLAAIDCSENGVAGAFTSIISHKILNDIIDNKHITEPDQILQSLHLNTKKLMGDGENNSGKGMDIALVVIDTTKRELKFAGAKSPLVYVMNGTIGTVAGSNAHIGGVERKEGTTFSQININLPQNEDFTFYLFTDGYQDQFGGEENKKLMRKNFLDLLHQAHRLPMVEQGKFLEECHEVWKGVTSQTDDILVMGVRLSKQS